MCFYFLKNFFDIIGTTTKNKIKANAKISINIKKSGITGFKDVLTVID